MKTKRILIAVGLAVGVVTVFAVPYSSVVSRYVVSPGLLSEPHAFLENRCSACHTPVKGIEGSSCIVCHANNEALLQRAPTAFHGNIGSCKECHIEHEGRIPHPIAMDHGALSRIGYRHMNNSGEGEFTPRVGFTSSSQSRLDCAVCHEKEDPHNTQFGSSCVVCHGTERWSIADFRHPSPRSQDCAQCHNIPPCHRTTHFRQVCATVADKPNARVEECFSCHQTVSWNDIKGVGWYKSH